MTNLAYQRSTRPGVEPSLRETANAIRALSMDAVEAANSGHPGMPMGVADVATVLFSKFLKFDAAAPNWPDRDRFVLSAGHGSMLLYSLLYLTGYPGMTIEQLKSFRQLGSSTAGHPEYGHAPGIETTTGPLGQGLANAVGMAIAERLMNARFGDAICNHRTFVIAGDGCLMEGISHEAIDLAGHLRLRNLIVLFDDNSISIDGPTGLSTSTDQLKRFDAAGWTVSRIDGHDTHQIEAALAETENSDRPSLIACRTMIGFGAPNKQGTAATHGSPLGKAEVEAARAQLHWAYPPFELPEELLNAWRAVGKRGKDDHSRWLAAYDKLPSDRRAEFDRTIEGRLPEALPRIIAGLKAKWLAEKPKLATRQSSQASLEAITAVMPELIGGSADLTGSNGTKVKSQKVVQPGDFSGSYIHYGVREHGMAAAMNGIALHGGFVPYGGTFLVFSDYCRPSIRLSALMKQRVIYVMTHDSIGLGEDGPTHQPVEHLASLRAIPNIHVFRPADAVETLEAWEWALENRKGPSILCLTRQGVPALRQEGQTENLVAKGAYVIREAASERQATFLATGSEVSLAIDAARRLETDGIYAAVVSMPSWELFRRQPLEYRREVLGDAPRIAIEAAVEMGWHEWLGDHGAFIGMKGFGASGPYELLYKHFGITVEAAVTAAKARMANARRAHEPLR
jgi:transketolase